MRKVLSLLLVLLSFLVLSACTSKATLTIKEADKAFELAIGSQRTVVINLSKEVDVEWSTSDASVAEVTNGKIQAVGLGNATITVKIKGQDDKHTITVTVVRPEATEVFITGLGTIVLGGFLQLSATVQPAAADQTLVWTSATTSVATVDNTGKVQGIGAGKSLVTATASNGKKAQVEVTVVLPDPTGITVTGATEVILDQESNYTATISPEVSNKEITWSVSDETLATIDQTGKLTALKAGNVKVIATSNSKNTIKGELSVLILLPAPTAITIAGDATVAIDQEATYTAVVAPAKASQDVVWSVSNTALATIDANGKLTAIHGGKVKVIATSSVKQTIVSEMEVTIPFLDATAVTVTGKATLTVGEVATYTAAVTPDKALQEVTWSVNNTAMASIDANGKVTAIAPGVFVVTATAKSNTEIKHDFIVTVLIPDLLGLEIVGPTSLYVDASALYKVEANPTSANAEVTWSVDNENLATVDANGMVTALAEGTVKLTATSVENNDIHAELEIVIRIPTNSFYVDANLQGENGTEVTYKDETFVVGVSAFKALTDVTPHLKANSTIYLMKGTYSGRVTILVNNISIIGPNAGISASEKMSSRLEEAILTSTIEISGTTGFFLDGVALKGTTQIYASKSVKDVTIQNINSFDANVDAGQGVVYFGLSTGINENIKVLQSSFKDNLGSGFRAIRVNNAKDTEIKNNYFYGFFDTIRFEGASNSDSVASAPGMHGKFIVENNKFEMTTQYPIMASRWSNADVSIRHNYIAVNPAGTGTYGIVHLNFYTPQADVKSTVYVQYNEIPYNTAWHQIRTNSQGATAAQLEYHVNYNKFYETPGIDGTTQLTHIADHWTTRTDFVIDGKNNYFMYSDEVLPVYFLNTNYQPIHRHEDEIGALFVNPLWTTEADGATVTYKHFTAVMGTNAFATLSAAVAKAQEGDVIFLLPGTHTGNVTLNVKNLKITSYNSFVNPNTQTRGEEAIYTGVMTLAKNLVGLEIAGIKFTGNAQILNTVATAGTAAAVTKNIEGFTFKNNIVESGLTSGNGFLYFKEAANSYSHDLVFENNYFTVTAEPTTLLAAVYIDNNAGLRVVGNVFESIPGDAFYVNDQTKGLAGETFVEGNKFKDIGGDGFWVNWFSALPSTTMGVKVLNNTFTNIGETAIYLGSLNNTDIMKYVNIEYNTLDNFKDGIVLNRVHAGGNFRVNFNIFRTVATESYIKDNKTAGAPVTLDAKHNLYLDNGVVIAPLAAKFAGSPDVTSTYTSESQVPVYGGEGDIVVTGLAFANANGPFYVGDTLALEVEFTPTNTTTKELSWKSSNAAIATVDSFGKVTFLTAGSVIITATSNRNPSIAVDVTMNVVSFEAIELQDSGNGVVEIGKTTKLNATVYPSNTPGTLTFTSLNPAIATVDAEGNVTGVSVGEVEIEVKIGELTATMTYVVSKARTTELDPIQFLMDANINTAIMRNVNTFGNTVKTEFVSGSVSNLWFNNMRIIEVLMEGRPKTKLSSLEFVVVHDTGNNNVGANAAMHSTFLKNNTSVSWHYTVDDEGAYKHIPHDEVGYHAGDGLREFGLNATGVTATVEKPIITISSDGYYELNGQKSTVKAPLIDGVIAKTNQITPSGIFTKIQDGQYYINNTYYNTTYKVIANHGGGANGIGIESAVDQGSDLYSTWQNLAQLVAKILVEHDLGLDRVLQHNNFSGKNCPQTLRTANLWDQLMTMVEFEYKRMKYFSDYTFTFVSNNPTIVNNQGKIISAPRLTTEVSYTVTITNSSGYNQSVTLYTTIPGTR